MQKLIKPHAPLQFQYEEKIERKFIYSFSASLREDEYDRDEDEYDESKNEPIKDIKEVNLAWLLSIAPEGVTPDRIKIAFGYNASSMAYKDHYVSFYYEEVIPARMEEYEADLNKYKNDLIQYEKDMIEYKEKVKLNKIAEVEETLRRLKNE